VSPDQKPTTPADEPKQARKRQVADPELQAVNDVIETLTGLGDPARTRVLRYVAARFAPAIDLNDPRG